MLNAECCGQIADVHTRALYGTLLYAIQNRKGEMPRAHWSRIGLRIEIHTEVRPSQFAMGRGLFTELLIIENRAHCPFG
jgi:hypothetical protein